MRSVMHRGDSIKVIGVISDTHGLLREQAIAVLAGVDLIVHAGDIGSPDVLDGLRAIAPVYAVRGNNDRDVWARELPLTDVVEAGAHQLYLLHDIADLDIDPAAAGFAAVVYGHSHKARSEHRDGVLYLNPGSAGPRRFNLPIALARLRVEDVLTPELITLEI
jgi:putative phosphoesterase